MVNETLQELTGGTDESEIERLRKEKEALAVELRSRDMRLTQVEKTLAERDGEITALNQAVADAEARLAEANSSLAQAVASYREMVVESNPGLLADMITGDTVEEVNESLKSARALVERVKQEIEAEASRTKVPAGAPQRTPPDTTGLSSREKIQYAIGGER